MEFGMSRPLSPAAPVDSLRPSTESGGRLRAVLLMAGSCLPVLGAVLLAPVLPKMQDHFAAVPGAKTLVPVVLTVPALALALLAPFAGVIVDRLGWSGRRFFTRCSVLLPCGWTRSAPS
jgi:MFS family permease